MSAKLENFHNTGALLFGALIFLNLRPYFIWENNIILLIAVFLAVFFTLAHLALFARVSKKSGLLILLFLLSFFLNQITSQGPIIWISVSVVAILCFLSMDEEVHYKTLKVFINIYALVSLPSILMFFFLAAGIDLEWEYLEPFSKAKQIKGVFYREYPGMVILSTQIYSFGTGELFRLSSVFAEPGVVGTVSALLLAATRFDLKSWQGILLLVSGILSFSLAFFALSILYLAFSRISLLAVLASAAMLALVLVPDDLRQNRIVEYYVIERLQNIFVDTATIDNRLNSCFEAQFAQYINTSDAILGNGHKASLRTKCNVSSYKTVIYDYGIIGFLLFTAIYILMFLLQTKGTAGQFKFIPILIVSAASLYQRPAFDYFWFFAIFLGSCTFIVSSNSDLHKKRR